MGRLNPKAGVSPVVATIILIAIFIIVVSAALNFADTELSGYYAQSDLQQSRSVSSQVAQSINSVAFTFGRSLSVGYSFKYASIAIIPDVMEYLITVQSESCPNNECQLTAYTGMLLIGIPAKYYTLGNNYQSIIYPGVFNLSKTFVSKGGSGSMALAFSKEFESGSNLFLYTAVIPLPLETNTTQSPLGSNPVFVVRIYLTQVSTLLNPYPLSPSCSAPPPQSPVYVFQQKSGFISVQGQGEEVCTINNIQSVEITAKPMGTLYPAGFFGFNSGQTINFNSNKNVELQVFIGDVGMGGA
ncbi:MAG: hypothetical protein QXP58_04940 [Thermoprotei archaeon]